MIESVQQDFLLDGLRNNNELFMKLKVTILSLLVSFTLINAEEWNIESVNYSMENDANVDIDGGYTHGARLSVLFSRENVKESYLQIPFTEINNKNHFISFAVANQMYNPYNQDNPDLIEDDRPYAGWSYIEIGLHQTTLVDSDSLTLQLGVVGPASKMQELQNYFHKTIDAGKSAGWEHQLGNEFTMQLNYMHKWRFELDDMYGLESVLVPYAGGNLGNVSIKASGGALYRVGYNITKDFGMNSMKEGSFSSLPMYPGAIANDKSLWSLYFNLTTGANLVARDMFLDGNTFKESHSIDKNYANAYMSGGITLRYKKFAIDYVHNYYTKEYDERGKYKKYKGYGSLIFTYSFD